MKEKIKTILISLGISILVALGLAFVMWLIHFIPFALFFKIMAVLFGIAIFLIVLDLVEQHRKGKQLEEKKDEVVS